MCWPPASALVLYAQNVMSPSLNPSGKQTYYVISRFLEKLKEIGPHTRKKVVFGLGYETFFRIKRYMERYRRGEQSGDYTYLSIKRRDPYFDQWRIYICNEAEIHDPNIITVDNVLVGRICPDGLERAQLRAKRLR